MNDFERQKKQADFLLKNRRYMLAIEEYDSLCRRLPDSESSLKPLVFHNIGVAYAGIFMFEMAARYFKRAYDMTKEEESGVEFHSHEALS